MLYFSYAANLNRSHMAHLCPGAEPLFTAVLQDYALTVRRWFNIEPQEGSEVVGGVWRLREEHLPKLDWYEDCPALYERKQVRGLPPGHGSVGAWEHGRSPHSSDVPNHGHTALRNCDPTDPRDHENTDTRTDDLLCLVYLMKKPYQFPLSLPDQAYLQLVFQGYDDWGISSEPLNAALGTSGKI